MKNVVIYGFVSLIILSLCGVVAHFVVTEYNKRRQETELMAKRRPLPDK